MENLEQELMSMLRRLPAPITITWRSGLSHGQCAQGSGSAPRLVAAAEAALHCVLKDVAGQVHTSHRETQV